LRFRFGIKIFCRRDGDCERLGISTALWKYPQKNRKMGRALARFLPAPSIASGILVGILN
jgi:hypothetical protein